MKIKVHLGEPVKELDTYIQRFRQRKDLLLERLAELGAHEASVRFTTAIYDGDNDVEVEVKPLDTGWVIIAAGQAVCFIEFGSGVHHNGAEPYPNPRPPGIVGIGEYGQGKGKRQAWGYYDGDELVITRGNPAAMPMWYASEEMRRSIEKIAREVFSS